jgi:hypothetical protein
MKLLLTLLFFLRLCADHKAAISILYLHMWHSVTLLVVCSVIRSAYPNTSSAWTRCSLPCHRNDQQLRTHHASQPAATLIYYTLILAKRIYMIGWIYDRNFMLRLNYSWRNRQNVWTIWPGSSNFHSFIVARLLDALSPYSWSCAMDSL